MAEAPDAEDLDLVLEVTEGRGRRKVAALDAE